jgi:hypothetical protein
MREASAADWGDKVAYVSHFLVALPHGRTNLRLRTDRVWGAVCHKLGCARI